jgi:hypothetical protein
MDARPVRRRPRYRLRRNLSEAAALALGVVVHVRKIMIVAVARKLAIALRRYVELGLVPQGAIINSPMTRKARSLLSLKGNNFHVSSRLRYRSCMCRKSHTGTILHLRQTIPKIRSPHGIIQWGISHVARLVCRDHWYAKRLESFAEFGAHEGA